MRIECPKCGGLAWLEVEKNDIWQRCLCGLLKLVETRLDSGITIRRVQRPDVRLLPRAGTKLSLCLGRLTVMRQATTGDLAALLDQSNSETASQLTVLMAKGLVERTQIRRGVEGGSMWQLTSLAKDILK